MNGNETAAREHRPAPLLLVALVAPVALALFLLLWGAHRAQSALNTPPALQPAPSQAQETHADSPWPAQPAAPEDAHTGPEYGVVFMSSAEAPADEQQYANALSTEASWNRWPIYWPNVEVAEDTFDWSSQDAAVNGDMQHGLQLNAILLGTPGFYWTGDGAQPAAPTGPRPTNRVALYPQETAAPQGLYDHIFTDDSDVPGPGKNINPDNKWARFVYMAVNRYKPGGALAQAHGWPEGVGVTHWEMWNEPDLDSFWNGTVEQYARLLKVGYIAAKHADPDATILFGGLAFFEADSFYDTVLALYDADPLAAAHNHFHDVMVVHNYFYAWRSWLNVYTLEQTLAARGMPKPIWLNESGVPAWNDYPGPVWDPTSGLRATTAEQANFVIQSALYATFAGADVIFHFQLYDGCGNQPQGTDFPPHDGSLCDANGRLVDNPDYPCAGDANGLFSNPTDAACFTQHPNPESPRPNYTAFRVLTTYFRDVQPLWRLRPGGADPYTGPQEWIAFYRPSTGERVLGLWSRTGEEQTAVVPATHGSALLVGPNAATQMLTATNGTYTLTLPAATNQNAFWDPSLYAIGGRPWLLIEPDTQAPLVTLQAPPFGRAGLLPISWEGDDQFGSGAVAYTVTVSVDGGPATTWLAGTAATAGAYPVELGRTYTFTVTARDRAGNLSSPATASVPIIDPTPFYLPTINP
ncbi:MAG: hypothetical protein R3248_12850 [Candidatus Promineifilaceae bacterium]|nr:hypothetical protein [Candidatus Promineifilaceae bacterium]